MERNFAGGGLSTTLKVDNLQRIAIDREWPDESVPLMTSKISDEDGGARGGKEPPVCLLWYRTELFHNLQMTFHKMTIRLPPAKYLGMA